MPDSVPALVGRGSALEGIINLDKPAGRSSAWLVSAVKRLVPRGARIGHAGTLDPFATGVLLLLVGRATKACEKLMDSPKQYEAAVRLGATTATGDPESPAVPWAPAGGGAVVPVAIDLIAPVLATFVGRIMQRPPVYSALKVGGRRAYDLVRRGVDVKLEPRPVNVYGIELLGYEWPVLRLRVDCGRGTYVRAIARDIGQLLDVGGYLTDLRRTRVGNFAVTDAVTPERLAAEGVAPHLKPAP